MTSYSEQSGDCDRCRAFRAAIGLFTASLVLLGLFAAFERADAEAPPLVACQKVELPGKQHTLNPNDPPAKQRQEVVEVCQQLSLPDMTPVGPVFVIAPQRTTA